MSDSMMSAGNRSALMWAAYRITFTVIYEDQRLRLNLAQETQGGPA